MGTKYQTRRSQQSCACKCHQESKQVHCCECYAKGYEVCQCGKQKRCCGEPQRPNRPDFPKAPGWEAGDKPPANPLAGATDFGDLKGKFNQAVINIMRESGSVKGPRFGQRKDEYLPYLLIRANAGDRGKRPLTVPFWESPDIFVAPNMEASAAPDAPPSLGGTAKAGVPNTLWAHVWNLGRAPVYNARLEFYWFNPSLGFNQEAANLIGVTHVDLGNRTSGNAHRIVKCPTTWIPSYVNGGHECLVTRLFEPLTDPLSPTQWDANNDRHIGQRNIAVVNASSPAQLELHIRLGCGTPPGKAELLIQEVRTNEFNWLTLLAGDRNHGYRQATDIRQIAGFTYPTLVRPASDSGTLHDIDPHSASRLLSQKLAFERGCDELEILFYLHVEELKSKECAPHASSDDPRITLDRDLGVF
ncbi:MAG TPA: hypothetical protein VK206_28590, partial [Anaerolineales bacterium]|nr:hypothetical protein [Anaerolineales bacterium]